MKKFLVFIIVMLAISLYAQGPQGVNIRIQQQLDPLPAPAVDVSDFTDFHFEAELDPGSGDIQDETMFSNGFFYQDIGLGVPNSYLFFDLGNFVGTWEPAMNFQVTIWEGLGDPVTTVFNCGEFAAGFAYYGWGFYPETVTIPPGPDVPILVPIDEPEFPVEVCVLTPSFASYQCGEDHTVTATLTDDTRSRGPVEGREITFEIISGPQVGIIDVGVTDVDGMAYFTYTGILEGTDTIAASFINNEGLLQSAEAEVMAEFLCPIAVETCVLSPEFASYQCGEDHTVTATLSDDRIRRGPVAGRMIDFEIISGPQVGTIGSAETDVDGMAYFTYTGVLEGTDTIAASFVNSEGLPQMAENEVMAEFLCPIAVETCVLTPEFASYQCGEDHTVTATLSDDSIRRGPVAGRMINFEIITGPQAGTVSSAETDVDGMAYFTYTGVLEGTDTIAASFVNSEGLPQMAENEVMAEFLCPIAVETCVLTPEFASYQCGEDHTVTATLSDDSIRRGPVAGRMINFEIITGPQAGTVSSAETDVDGMAYFTYTGVLEGTDTIAASFVNSEGLPQMAENEVMAEFLCPPQPNAWIRYVELDNICYNPCDDVEITVEVDTDLPEQYILVDINILDDNDVNIIGTTRTLWINLENDEAFTEILMIPCPTVSSFYNVQVIVYDGNSLVQQDSQLVYFDDCQVPVTLSSFTAVYDNVPTLNWTTQSESNNLGWNVYRSLFENVELSNQINDLLIPGNGTTTEPTQYVYNDLSDVESNTTYWYWLESASYNGETELYGPVTLTIQDDNQLPDLPTASILHNNYPNPFNPSTMIDFSINQGESGSLTILNAKGQIMETHSYEAGEHQFNWDATQYSSGIYFYKLETQTYTNIKKMIMVK